MKTEWSLSNGKAIFNFTERYYSSFDQVLDSEAFRSLIDHFLTDAEGQEYSEMFRLIKFYFPQQTREARIMAMTRLAKLLTSMNILEISQSIPEFHKAYEDRAAILRLVEEIYKYWRNLERYAVFYETTTSAGLATSSFQNAKTRFDEMLLALYREISVNVALEKPNVLRQIKAGTNVGLVCKAYVWPILEGYEKLRSIAFVKGLILETPFISYPKRNTRTGVFPELLQNPLERIGINDNHFFCFPCFVGEYLAFVYVQRDYLTHGVSLANLFQLATEEQVSGRKPDLIYVFGGDNHLEEPEEGFYHDERNDIMIGFVSHHDCYDYFGYMKKMMLTLHNVRQISKGNLPIHGAMVHIVLKNGKQANVVIMGDSGAGKSESIEAFRALAKDHISEMDIIFDDMGTFRIDPETDQVRGYGTEIGAFVRLDDLDSGYAFQELDRSIFMNPDKVNARLITPVATYDEIMEGLKVDIFVYANNYEPVEEGEKAIKIFENKEEALPTFVQGKRMAKGTTSEKGITTSYFANPFGPVQKQQETDVLIDRFFSKLFKNDVVVGTLRTQLGVPDKAQDGPKLAAIDLFDLIKSLPE